MNNVKLAHFGVVVVGAGIAGLSAADALYRAGMTVMVHEARNRVGGRARSLPAGTGAVEMGATWFWPNEPLTRSYVDQLGIETFPQHLHGDAVFEADRHGVHRLDGNPIDVASSRFTAGAQSLAQRLSDRLASGTLRLDDPVTSLTATEDGVTVVARSGALRADHVIVAVPPALAAEQISFTPALPDPVKAAAEATAVWMGATVKAVAVYDHPFWRAEGLSGSAISHTGPFLEFHDHSGPDAAPAALFAFGLADRFSGLDAEAIGAAFRGQLTRLYGRHASRPRELHITDWSRERFTMPRLVAPRAATTTYGAAVFQDAVHDRIRWASTETATAYAGHIEGALRAGLAAARAVVSTQHPATVTRFDAIARSALRK